jgi:hypothetical protein
MAVKALKLLGGPCELLDDREVAELNGRQGIETFLTFASARRAGVLQS